MQATKAYRNLLPKDKRQPSSKGPEQATLFIWVRKMEGCYPELRLMFHIPNGGGRRKAEAGHFKMESVKGGVPDIFLLVTAATITTCLSG